MTMKFKPFFIILILVGLVCVLLGCKNSLLDRSLVFSTNTTTGLEISLNPSEIGGSPVKLVAGYKRQELALVPVYDRYGITGSGEQATRTTTQTLSDGSKSVAVQVLPSEAGKGPKYLEEAYSVIAKIASDVGGSANSSAKYNSAPQVPGEQTNDNAVNGTTGVDGHLNNAQWFATGQAAKTLASQPGISGAVVGSPAVARASVDGSVGLSGLHGEERAFAMASLILLYESINEAAVHGDYVAQRIKAQFDQAATSFPLPETQEFSFYRRDLKSDVDSTEALQAIPDADERLKVLSGFQKLMAYSKMLRGSAEAIDAEVADSQSEIMDEQGISREVADKSLLIREAKRQRAADDKFASVLSKNEQFRNALTEFYSTYILSAEGKK